MSLRQFGGMLTSKRQGKYSDDQKILSLPPTLNALLLGTIFFGLSVYVLLREEEKWEI